jgi:small subunit ribosomal protein S6
MKRYETIVIIDPDLPKEAEAPIFERVNDLIPHYGGVLVGTDDWGTKKLAYDIKKKNRGHYVRLDFCGDGALVQEMERFFRIDDNVMKFMTVLLDEDADMDAVNAEIAEKKAAEEKTAEAAPAPEPEATAKPETAPEPETAAEPEAAPEPEATADDSEPEETEKE